MAIFSGKTGGAIGGNGLMSLGDLLMNIWLDYLAHYRAYLPLAGLTTLGYVFLLPSILLQVQGISSDGSILSLDNDGQGSVVLLSALGTVVIIVSHLYARISLIRSVSENGKKRKFRDALGEVRELIWPFLLASLLFYIAMSIGFALLFIPGIIVGIYFMFAEQSVVLEKLAPVNALKHSWRLVRGHFWPVLWRTVIGYVVIASGTFIVSVPLVQLPTTIFGRIFSDDLSGLRASLILPMLLGAALSSLAMPLYVSLQVHLYEQLEKLQKEE